MNPFVLVLMLAQASPEATMTGRVTDSITHQPIAGAMARFCCPRSDATTNDDGVYTLRVVPVSSPMNGGRPTLDFSKPGYSPVFRMDRERPNLRLGETFNFDAELVPQATISGRVVDRDSASP